MRAARRGIRESAASFIGAFVGIGILGMLTGSDLPALEDIFLIGSFGATCVLIYGMPNSPLAQPRNVVGGHVLSALVGVAVTHAPLPPWMISALAVALSILVMQWTDTEHPPGGATALIATLGGPKIEDLGFFYAFHPVGVGASLLVGVAILVNWGGGASIRERIGRPSNPGRGSRRE